MHRLHPSSLSQLPAAVQRPNYDFTAALPGIVHLGLGAFHRAHQAVYTDTAMAHSQGDWRIIGVSMRSARLAEQLLPQECLFSVLSEDGNAVHLRVIGSIANVLVAPEEPQAVIAAIADPAVHIISLTITEKGYMLAADGKSLDWTNHDLQSDLANPASPVSALGLLAAGLRLRAEQNREPLTVMSCDNLSENSSLLHGLLVEYLEKSAPTLLPWLEEAVSFPCTMVDRIVPASHSAQIEQHAIALGLYDAAAVRTEPFGQWFIEDNFVTPRPDWEAAGATLVDDVRPYELIKLRLLNATHSAIAQYGLLAGLETVDAVMREPILGRAIEQLMDEELIPALSAPPGFDMAGYYQQLLSRFSNPCLQHRCAQIAIDSSEKIAQRWLPRLSSESAPHSLRALAAWVYIILCTDIPIEDPRAELLNEVRESGSTLKQRVIAVLSAARITADAVTSFKDTCEVVVGHIQQIQTCGVLEFLQLTAPRKKQ